MFRARASIVTGTPSESLAGLIAERNELYAMLLTVLGILIAVETILDRRELLGSHCSEEEIAGRNVSEILVGQPVIPDRICMLLSKELNAEEWRFEYEADYVFPHCYPYMAMLISNGRVILCEVRDSAGKSCYDDL